MSITPQKYFEKLSKHDWLYRYSDDNRIYKKGAKDEIELNEIAMIMGGVYKEMHDSWKKYYTGSISQNERTMPCIDDFIKSKPKLLTTKEYLDYSEKTECLFEEGLFLDQKRARLLHAAMGMETEVGEFMDVLKKNICYGKEIDYVNMKEEIGDILFYVAIAIRVMGTSFEEIMTTNFNKLKARFPDGFKEIDALNRNLNREREILENE